MNETDLPQGNLFAKFPAKLPEELINVIVENRHVRIEQIVSTGQSSPDGFWYDQDDDEWVIVLKGEATLFFDASAPVQMKPGDHILIPAHRRHRVEWTSPSEPTIWLAVFF